MPGMDEELLAVPGICLRWKRICTADFCFFLPTPSNYLMEKNKTSKKFTTFNDEEKGRMVTLSYISSKKAKFETIFVRGKECLIHPDAVLLA